MKKIVLLAAMIFIAVVSCKNENQNQNLEVKVADEHNHSATKKLDVKVDNRLDPICEMETTGHLSDTIHYNGKIYGFCSSGCKEEFAKNPEQYLSKLGN